MTILKAEITQAKTTRVEVDAARAAGKITVGRLYYLTDEEILVVGTADDAVFDLRTDVVSKGEQVPGAGNVWDDVNAYMFTGPDSDGQGRMCIGPGDLGYVGHGGIVYRYFGPGSVCIGAGGAGGAYPHRVTVSEDWVATGTADHGALSNRDDVDAHPQAAITGLVTDQATQNGRLDTVETDTGQLRTEHDALSDAHNNLHGDVFAIRNFLQNLAQSQFSGVAFRESITPINFSSGSPIVPDRVPVPLELASDQYASPDWVSLTADGYGLKIDFNGSLFTPPDGTILARVSAVIQIKCEDESATWGVTLGLWDGSELILGQFLDGETGSGFLQTTVVAAPFTYPMTPLHNLKDGDEFYFYARSSPGTTLQITDAQISIEGAADMVNLVPAITGDE